MEYYTNHCWCSMSNWDDDHFDCKYLITIDKNVDEEFESMLNETKYFDQEAYDLQNKILKEALPDKDLSSVLNKEYYYRKSQTLSPEAVNWLLENVEDDKDGKAWCIGNNEYNSLGSDYKFTLFFKRRKDAIDFVKHWSKYKKPTTYFDYFRDKRKELDLETGKYTITQR